MAKNRHYLLKNGKVVTFKKQNDKDAKLYAAMKNSKGKIYTECDKNGKVLNAKKAAKKTKK